MSARLSTNFYSDISNFWTWFNKRVSFIVHASIECMNITKNIAVFIYLLYDWDLSRSIGYRSIEESSHIHIFFLFLGGWGRSFLLFLFLLVVLLGLFSRCSGSGSGSGSAWNSTEVEERWDIFSGKSLCEELGPETFNLNSWGGNQFCDLLA